MAGGEQRGERPGGPARVALQKEIGLGSACAIIIGKGGAAAAGPGLRGCLLGEPPEPLRWVPGAAGRLAPRLAPRHRWLHPAGSPLSGAGGKGRLV